MFQYEATLIRVVDGDTIIFDVDLGFRFHVEQVIRLAHVNAPEEVKWDVGGLNDPAKQYIEKVIPPGSAVVLNTIKSEKYGRWLAEVLYSTGVSDRDEILKAPRALHLELIQKGLAKSYEGGRK